MKRDVFWNLAGTLATVLTTLLTVPLFLRVFGPERYGLLATAWVVLGYFSFLDLGMGPAVVSALSRPEARERDSASGVFWTAFLMNLVIGLVLAGIGVGVILGLRASGWLAPAAVNDELIAALPLLALMLPVSLVHPILVGAFDARREFRLANLNQIFGSVLFQVLPLVLALAWPATLATAAAGSLLGRVTSVALLLGFAAARLDIGSPRFERQHLRGLGSFGGWVALSSMISALLDTADRVVIAAILGGRQAAWYAIAYNVVVRLRSLPAGLTRALFPRISADPDAAEAELSLALRTLSLVLVPTTSLAVVSAGPLLTLWLGGGPAASVVPLFEIMLLGTFYNCLAFIPVVLLQASGRPATAARIHLIEAPVFLTSMVLSTLWFGVTGAAVIWSLRGVVDAVLMFGAAQLRRPLVWDIAVPSILPIAGFALVHAPLGGVAQGLGVVVLLVLWAVWDSVRAARSGTSLTLWRLAGRVLLPRQSTVSSTNAT